MAVKIVSPGVVTRENDQSQITEGPVVAGAALIGPTVKGPVNEPTVITSYSDYKSKFGTTIESGGANVGNGSGTWFDIANHDLNVPLVDKARNLQLHLNASDTTSYGGSGNDLTDISQNSNTATDTSPTFS